MITETFASVNIAHWEGNKWVWKCDGVEGEQLWVESSSSLLLFYSFFLDVIVHYCHSIVGGHHWRQRLKDEGTVVFGTHRETFDDFKRGGEKRWRRERVNDEGVGELPEHQRWRQMELRIKESFTKAEGWLMPTNYKTPVSIQERNYDWCGAKNNRLWWKLQQRSRLCWSSRRSFITTEEQRQQQDEAGTWPRRNLSISCMLASTAR